MHTKLNNEQGRLFLQVENEQDQLMFAHLQFCARMGERRGIEVKVWGKADERASKIPR